MTQPPLTDEDLIAFLENTLSSTERAQIERRINADPMAQAKLLDWAQQNADIQTLYGDLSGHPPPERLRETLYQTPRPAPRRDTGARGLRIAAMLGLLATGTAAGWFSHAALGPDARPIQLAQAALRAHDTYVVEVTHPVEVTADQRSHMDSWMSKRIGAPLSPPDLSAAGFTLMGGRILPHGAEPAGLYMYENADGLRITLYVSRATTGDSAFQFAGQGPTQSLHWSDSGLGYALTGDLPRNTLKSVAKQAYDQLI